MLAGGADFQLLRSATLTELEAKYAIETDSGERIYINNFGIRTGSPEDIAALVRNEPVPPERIYFRCSPRALAGGPEWSWLSSRILLGSGTRLPDQVRCRTSPGGRLGLRASDQVGRPSPASAARPLGWSMRPRRSISGGRA